MSCFIYNTLNVKKYLLISLVFALINLFNLLNAQDFTFVDQLFDYDHGGPRMIDATDFDNDGELEFVVTYFEPVGLPTIVTYDPYYNGISRWIVDNQLNYAYDVETADLDSDGFVDFVVTASNHTYFYKNTSGTHFLFQKYEIGNLTYDQRELEIVDFDGDGDLDILTSSPSNSNITWFQNLGGTNFNIKTIDVQGTTWGLKVIDLDQDGIMDILANRDGVNDVIWVKPIYNPTDTSFQITVLDSGYGYSFDVNAGDIDGDGDIDVLATDGNNGYLIALFNDGTQNFTRQVIDSNLPGADNVNIADMNNDGIIDIVASSWSNSSTDGIYVYDGSNGYSKNTIAKNIYGGAGFVICDIDSDGDNDAVACFNKDQKVIQFFNQKIRPSTPFYLINPVNFFFPLTVVGEQSIINAEITNIGMTNLEINDISAAGDFSCDSYNGNLAPDSSIMINVYFNPSQVYSSLSSTLVVYSNGSGRNANLNGSSYNPYTTLFENFDSSTNMPDGWSSIIVNNNNGIVKVIEYDPYAHSPHNSLYIRNYDLTSGEIVAVTPALQRSENGNILKFWSRTGSGNGTQNLHIGILTDADDLNTFHLLQTVQPNETYQEFIINIPADSVYGDYVFVAFKHDLSTTNVRYCVDDFSWEEDLPSEIIQNTEVIPSVFKLHQNYPNPFNPTTTIVYELPEISDVTLSIFNTLGKKIKTLVQKRQSANTYRVSWDGTDDSGTPVASGIYLYQLRAGDFMQTRKMVLMR